MPSAAANVQVLVRVRPPNDKERRSASSGRSLNVLVLDGGSGGGGGGRHNNHHRNNAGNGDSIDFNGSGNGVDGDGGASGGGGATITVLDLGMTTSGGIGGGGGGGSSSGVASGYGSDGGYVSSGMVGGGGGGGVGVGKKKFTFDAVHGPRSTQADVFESVKGIVEAVAAGYNGTIVAYGQTGSGKTHTVFGNDSCKTNAGLVERCLQALFRSIAMSQAEAATSSCGDDSRFEESLEEAEEEDGSIRKTTARASFYEIFNERVYDLLSEDESLEKWLPVREDSVKGVYVEGMNEVEVTSIADTKHVLTRGMANRHVASTSMNRTSSRSHAVFCLTVKSVYTSSDGLSRVRTSKFNLVDLAGSERQKSTDAAGDRLREASMINTSLSALGNVINALVARERGCERHVPFRDSKLTFLLRDSWGGNSKTCLVATVSPSAFSITETMSTLKFAQRAKEIKNKAVLNEDTCGNVEALQAEVARLRCQLQQAEAAALRTCAVASPAALSSSLPSSRRPPLPVPPGASTSSPSLMSSPRSGSGDEGDKCESDLVSLLRRKMRRAERESEVLRKRMLQEEEKNRSLKRKLLDETMVRKFKQRRIEYLSNQARGYEADADDEVEVLCGEIDALRRQVDAPSVEAVETRVEYERLQEELEERMERQGERLDEKERRRLEDTVVKLLDEKEALERKVDDLAKCTASNQLEIDSILPEVERLEEELELRKDRILALEEEARHASQRASTAELKSDQYHLELLVARETKLSLEAKVANLQETALELEAALERLIKEVEEKSAAIDKIKASYEITEAELSAKVEEHVGQLELANVALKEKASAESKAREQLFALSGENRSLAKRVEDTAAKLEEQKLLLEEAQSRVQSLTKEKDEIELKAQKDLTETKESLENQLGTLDREKKSLQENLLKAEKTNNDMRELQAVADGELNSLRSRLAESEQQKIILQKEKEQSLVELQKIADEAGASFSANLKFLAEEKKNLMLKLEDVRQAAQSELESAKARHHAEVTDLEQQIQTLEEQKKCIMIKAESERNEANSSIESLARSAEQEKKVILHKLFDLAGHLEKAHAKESVIAQELSRSDSLVSELHQKVVALEKRVVTIQEEKDRVVSYVQRDLKANQEIMGNKLEELETQRVKLLKEKLEAEACYKEMEDAHMKQLADVKSRSAATVKELEQKFDAVEAEKIRVLAERKKAFEVLESELLAKVAVLEKEISRLLEQKHCIELTLEESKKHASEAVAEEQNRHKQLKAEMDQQLQSLCDEKEAELNETRRCMQAEIQSKNDALEMVRVEFDQVSSKLPLLEAENGALLKQIEVSASQSVEIRELRQALEESECRIKVIEESANKYLDIQAKLESELEAKERQVADAKSQATNATAKVAELLEAMNKSERTFHQEIADAKAKYESSFIKFEMLDVEHKIMQKQAAEWEKQADDAKKNQVMLQDRLQIANRALQSMQTELDTLREDRELFSERIRVLNCQNKDLKEENSRLRCDLKSYGKCPVDHEYDGALARNFHLENTSDNSPNPAAPEEEKLGATPFRDLSSRMDTMISKMTAKTPQADAAEELDDSFDESMFLPNNSANAPATPEFLRAQTTLNSLDDKENMRTPTYKQTAKTPKTKRSTKKTVHKSAKTKLYQTPITRSALKRMPLSERKENMTAPLESSSVVKKFPLVTSDTKYRTGWSSNFKV